MSTGLAWNVNGGNNCEILVNGYVATYFQQNERTAALGLSLGLGRIGAIFGPSLGGWIAASALGVEWNFYAFALFAVIGCVATSLVRQPATGSGQRSQSVAQPTPGQLPVTTAP